MYDQSIEESIFVNDFSKQFIGRCKVIATIDRRGKMQQTIVNMIPCRTKHMLKHLINNI